MLKYLDTTGRNEEEAIAAALAQLQLDRDDVSVEILERAKSGFLGIGSCPAKVRVTYEVPDEVLPEEPAPTPVVEEPVPVEEEKPAAPAAEVEKEEPVAPAGDEKAEKIIAFLSGLMEHMDVKATPSVERTEEGIYRVNLEGENLGAIIGRRGETLDAIQQLTSYSVNRGASKRVRIQVDAEHYRAKREESLIRLANRVADKVVKYHRNVTLEPMNAYERHVIHTALQDYPGVTTYSTGVEPNRRTVVAYEK
ncbi:MAG: RNA-binding cell elongation regulator Jag/EloR [Oscillospiraceae bacterium]